MRCLAQVGAGPRHPPQKLSPWRQRGQRRTFPRFPNSWGWVRLKSPGPSWGKKGAGLGVGKPVHMFLIHGAGPAGPCKKAFFSRSRKSCPLAVNKLFVGGRGCLGRGWVGKPPPPLALLPLRLPAGPLALPVASLQVNLCLPTTGSGQTRASCAHLEWLRAVASTLGEGGRWRWGRRRERRGWASILGGRMDGQSGGLASQGCSGDFPPELRPQRTRRPVSKKPRPRASLEPGGAAACSVGNCWEHLSTRVS